MDRINGAGTVDIGGGRRGFIDEDLGVGQEGTEVPALWLNMTQEEMIKVIETAGLVLNPADWTQLWQALQILGLSAGARSRRWTAVISMTLSSAPGAPAAGDTYLVPTGATGIWATQVGKIAEWNGTAWVYFTPVDGHGISLPDGRIYERIGGIYAQKLALDVQSGKWNYAVAGGTANALTVTLEPVPTSLTSLVGAPIRIKSAAANTGAMTLDVNGLGPVAIKTISGGAISPGGVPNGAIVTVVYDGTIFQIQTGSALPSAAGISLLQNNGLGALSWVSAGSIAKPAVILSDQRAAGALGDALVTATWTARTLQTETIPDPTLCTLATNQFTVLQNCFCRFQAPAYAVNRYRHRIYNVTDAVAVAYSGSGYTGNSSIDTQTSADGVCSLLAGKTYRLDTWAQTGGSNAGGLSGMDGGPSLFSQIELYRL